MIQHPDTFARDLPAGYDGLFDWDFLRGAFGDSIMPMDFDGVVERNGRFLMFETKTPGARIPQGQQITIRSLVTSPLWTVIVCAKRPGDIRGWYVLTRDGCTTYHGNAAALRAWCAGWFDHVNSLGREPGEEG